MAIVTVTIDGETLEVADGTLILDLAHSQGIHIPTFCYQKRLTTLASCRMCLVEIEGHFSLEKRLQPACATRITDGMVVKTDTPLIAQTRQSMLEILLANHPLDCPVCDKAGECELQDTVFAYGAGESRFTDNKRVFRSEDIHLNPVIVFNAQRCIQCQRCVRMCEEVVGAVALGTAERGMDAEITGFGDSLTDCDHCGNCIEVCPVGALMSSPYRYKARPWDLTEVDTVCPYCGTGCHLTVGLREGRLARVRSKYETGVNGETLCVKGRFGLDFIDGEDKLRRPMVRKDGALAAVSWEEALNHMVERAGAAAEKGAVGGLVSPRLANEALYLFQKLIRTAFHSNSIDSSTRWSASDPAASGSDVPMSDAPGPYQALEGLFGGLYARHSLHQALKADCILVIGSNVTESNPVSEYLMRDAARNGGKQLFVVSSRPSRLDSEAASSLRLAPGGEATLLSTMLNALAGNDGNGEDAPAFCREFLECVVPALTAASEVTIMVGIDVLRSPRAALVLRMLGNLGRTLEASGKRAGVQFLFDRPNQMGAWELGALPTVLPGWRPVDDASARALFEDAWGMSLPPQPGADVHQMLTRCEAGEMEMLYVVGSDPLLSYPDGKLAESALSKCGLLIVQDAFLSATAHLADVVLPAAAFAEEAGTFTSNEGRVQKLRPIRRPAFEARSNMEIFALLASALGHDLGSTAAPDVFSEITRLVPSYGGLGRDAIGSAGGAFTVPSVPSVVPADNGGPASGDMPVAAPGESQSHESGELELVTGDCLFHSGYISQNSTILETLAAEPYVEMSPREASALGLSDRDQVIIRSRHGEAKARLRVTKHFPDGVVFIPENFAEMRLNLLIKQGEHPCRVAVCKEEGIRDTIAT